MIFLSAISTIACENRSEYAKFMERFWSNGSDIYPYCGESEQIMDSLGPWARSGLINKNYSMIVDGAKFNKTQINWPWLVMLKANQITATGIIIGKRWIYCTLREEHANVFHMNISSVRVLNSGNATINFLDENNEMDVRVKRIHLGPMSIQPDAVKVVLLELNEPIPLSNDNAFPICLPKEDNEIRSDKTGLLRFRRAWIAGWEQGQDQQEQNNTIYSQYTIPFRFEKPFRFRDDRWFKYEVWKGNITNSSESHPYMHIDGDFDIFIQSYTAWTNGFRPRNGRNVLEGYFWFHVASIRQLDMDKTGNNIKKAIQIRTVPYCLWIAKITNYEVECLMLPNSANLYIIGQPRYIFRDEYDMPVPDIYSQHGWIN